jgi:hypothetical protein
MANLDGSDGGSGWGLVATQVAMLLSDIKLDNDWGY